MTIQTKKPLLLCILDGWGMGDDASPHNAIARANTPVFDNLWSNNPHTSLRADGLNVGLPEGQFGNSEVGHLNIGAGRVVMQDLPRINQAVANGSLAQNPELLAFAAQLKQQNGAAHLLGLVSEGGVHAHQQHIVALAAALSALQVPVWVHVVTDGRDTPPQGSITSLPPVLAQLQNLPNVRLATIAGRYYTMDRDNRWERVSLAWQAMVRGTGVQAATQDVTALLQDNYHSGKNDEFVLPTVLPGYTGVAPHDGWVMANFRADRARQILRSLWLPNFIDFDRGDYVVPSACLGMVEYADDLNQVQRTLFASVALNDIFSEVVAKAGLKQLHAAETEKYAHVTFFFNGGEEKRHEGEDWLLVPSPKVATYDLAPAMSAPELAAQVAAKINEGIYDVVIVNFANPDMVGHTGDMAATIQAVETVDTALGTLWQEVQSQNGVAVVIADHGNADQMWDDATNQPHTAHTLAPVPCIVAGAIGDLALRGDGVLGDVAPTLLQLLGVAQPAAMTGKSLIVSGV